MINKLFKATALSVSLFICQNAAAGVIYDFDISTQTLNTGVDYTGYMIVAEFKDTAVLSALHDNDLINFGFNKNGVDVFATEIDKKEIDAMFGVTSNDQFSLTLGGSRFGNNDYPYVFGVNSMGNMQIGRFLTHNIWIPDGLSQKVATSNQVINTFIGVARGAGPTPVIEPSTLAIFALGLVGLASRRLRRLF